MSWSSDNSAWIIGDPYAPFERSEPLWQISDRLDTGPGAGGEGSAVIIDGTMTVSDDGGKSIQEEAVNTMKINRQIAAIALNPRLI
jgi:hypothetical protein